MKKIPNEIEFRQKEIEQKKNDQKNKLNRKID